jgi:hypothetical protein
VRLWLVGCMGVGGDKKTGIFVDRRRRMRDGRERERESTARASGEWWMNA